MGAKDMRRRWRWRCWRWRHECKQTRSATMQKLEVDATHARTNTDVAPASFQNHGKQFATWASSLVISYVLHLLHHLLTRNWKSPQSLICFYGIFGSHINQVQRWRVCTGKATQKATILTRKSMIAPTVDWTSLILNTSAKEKSQELNCSLREQVMSSISPSAPTISLVSYKKCVGSPLLAGLSLSL